MLQCVIIINNSLVQITNEILDFIYNKIPQIQIKIYDDSDLDHTIINEYQSGTKLFILYLKSQQLVDHQSIFITYPNAYYICPSSNVFSLRNEIYNLYFTGASTKYLELVESDTAGYNRGIVYNEEDNIFIEEVLEIFNSKTKSESINIHDSNISSFLDKYQNILFVSSDASAYNLLADHISQKPQFNYNVYAIEIFPNDSFILPPNIVNISVAQNKHSVYPQINSRWNYLLSNGEFSYGNFVVGILPVLLNVTNSVENHIATLVQMNIISKSLQLNGFLYSRYLKTYPDLQIKYNTINSHLDGKTNQKIIWIIDSKQKSRRKLWNISYIKKINPLIHEIIFSDHFECLVCNYYLMGYRNFILDGSTQLIKPVIKLALQDAMFICTRSTDDAIRKPGSNFFFMLASDITIIEEKIAAVYHITRGRMQFLLGESDNSNIDLMRQKMNQLNIPNININELEKIVPNNIMIHSLGTEAETNRLVVYMQQNDEKITKSLVVYHKHETYFSDFQINTLANFKFRLENFMKYNSCQPFLDSEYSFLSIPHNVLLYTNFYDINAVLFSLDLKFLFDFGYIIDI